MIALDPASSRSGNGVWHWWGSLVSGTSAPGGFNPGVARCCTKRYHMTIGCLAMCIGCIGRSPLPHISSNLSDRLFVEIYFSDFMLTAFSQTRPAGIELDGVGIVAILNKDTGSELLLQKQYRPPIDAVVIEVPAGLIDAGETPEQCAVRELKEETGYVGDAEQTSPVMYNGT